MNLVLGNRAERLDAGEYLQCSKLKPSESINSLGNVITKTKKQACNKRTESQTMKNNLEYKQNMEIYKKQLTTHTVP